MAALATNRTNRGDDSAGTVHSRRMRVIGQHGLHLRAASEIVRMVRKFDADVTLEYQGLRADARSILSIACLAVAHNGLVHATATGRDALQALTALEDLFISGFGESCAKSPSPESLGVPSESGGRETLGLEAEGGG